MTNPIPILFAPFSQLPVGFVAFRTFALNKGSSRIQSKGLIKIIGVVHHQPICWHVKFRTAQNFGFSFSFLFLVLLVFLAFLVAFFSGLIRLT